MLGPKWPKADSSYFVVQSLSCVGLSVTPWTVAGQASLSSTISWSLWKFMFIESVMPFNHPILSPPSPLSLNLSQHHGLFQWVGSLHQVVKVLSFSFSISLSNEYNPLFLWRWITVPIEMNCHHEEILSSGWQLWVIPLVMWNECVHIFLIRQLLAHVRIHI